MGHRDVFSYHECADCRTINLADELTAADLARYYGPGYYSFGPDHLSALRRFAVDQRDRAMAGLFTPIGGILARIKPDPELALMRSHGLPRDARILDVGCGAGQLLDRLAKLGYTDLLGIDPFISKDTHSKGGVPILRRHIADIDGAYDLVMFNHSLEHMSAPRDALFEARRLLATGGRCVVRAPTVCSAAWEEYGVDWVQFDAPRHAFLPSRDGMRIAGSAAGMWFDRSVDDSSAFQFWGSEQYRRDIPLSNPQIFTGMFNKA